MVDKPRRVSRSLKGESILEGSGQAGSLSYRGATCERRFLTASLRLSRSDPAQPRMDTNSEKQTIDTDCTDSHGIHPCQSVESVSALHSCPLVFIRGFFWMAAATKQTWDQTPDRSRACAAVR